MEELLDDGEIKSTGIGAVQVELSKFKFWLYFSAILLVIVGVMGILLSAQVFMDAYSYRNDRPFFLLLVGMTMAFALAIPMCFTHLRYAQNAKEGANLEIEENFTNLAKSSAKDWRLLALAFLFSGISVAQFFSYQVYRDMTYYSYEEETIPEEWAEPPLEGELEPILDEEEPLEDDPAPPVN